MRVFLRILAIASAVSVIAFWYAAGANLGWYKTSVPVKHVDPVTEIVFTEYEQRFIPGVEFLGVGLLGCAALFSVTFLFSKNKAKHRTL